MPVLERMAEIGMPLLCHGEVVDPAIDIFDREKAFIETVLEPLRRDLPELRVVMDAYHHGRCSLTSPAQHKIMAATITTHHLMINRNHILAGGSGHYYCLPVAKRKSTVWPCGGSDFG